MLTTGREGMARSNATKAAAELTLILKQLSGNSARRQRQRLLAAMLEFGSVTTVDATRFLDIIDPRARIFELRRQGYRISTMPVARATECGVVHVVGSYLLLSSSPQASAPSGSADWVQMPLPLSACDDRGLNFQAH